MIKIKLDADPKIAEAYLKEIALNPLLSDFDVNINNVNNFGLYLEELKNCKECSGLANCKNFHQGHLFRPEADGFVSEPCQWQKDADRVLAENSLIKTLFVPKNILNADLNHFEITTENRKKIFDYILKFMDKQKSHQYMKGLYIYGDFATGKTFVLGCIANELAKNQLSSLIIYFPDLIVELKNAMNTARFEELMNHLKSVDVLLLDDVGSENMTSWVRDEILGPVLNYRLMEEKPIFISSNIDPTNDGLLKHFSITNAASDQLKGQRLISRLNGLVQTIELENASYKR